MKIRRFALILFMGIVSIATPGHRAIAQQADLTPAQGSTPVIRAETRLVLVDAVVTDKKGNYIRDLAAHDFRVWEDNKEQRITSFSSEAGNADQTKPKKHYMILFFDNSTMSLPEQGQAHLAAAQFLEANAGPHRLMAVVEFSGVLHVTQNFTDNIDHLKKVVAGAKPSAVLASSDDYLLRGESGFGARSVILALRSLAKDLGEVPGRKSLVMFSSGFPLNPESSAEVTAAIDACNKSNVTIYPIDVRGLRAPSTLGQLRPFSPGIFRSSSANVEMTANHQTNYAPHLLNASYSPDLLQHGGGGGGGGQRGGGGGGGGHGGGAGTGRTGGGSAPSVPRYQVYSPNDQPHLILPMLNNNIDLNQQVLYMLAQGTGGFRIINTNDFLTGLEKINKEQTEYYLLGYKPAPSKVGSCHTLKVAVNRRDTSVRSRSGYCNVKMPNPLEGLPVEKELEKQVSSSQPSTAFASMEAPYFYISPNTARVNLAVQIPGDTITFEKEKGRFESVVNVLGIAYKEDNSIAARFSDSVTISVDGKKEVEKFRRLPFHHEEQFDIAAGQYTLKVAYSCGKGSFGKVELPLTVDPYNDQQFGLSGIALSKDLRRVADLNAGLDAALLEDHTPLVSGGMQFVPSANNRFKRTDKAAIYVEVYEPLLLKPNPPKVALEVKVLEKQTGQPKLDVGFTNTASSMHPGNPVVPLGLRLPVDSLASGTYRVELTAMDSAGNKSALRSADFLVE